MTTITEQYTEFAQRGQEAAMAVVDAWTSSLRETTIKVPSVTAQAAAHQVIDQMFDFTGQVINVQRNLVKQLVTSSATVAEDVARRTTEAVNEAGAATVSAVQRSTQQSA